ncbi:hypothetical protein OR1_00948 [Geobacter sp. OR-1]|uniref:hypothetical protein n=1 Tax=Geobacter sp. OR-1 TaxID=1266765 RepID=UPI0005429D44|nr:hypothetical protein [Geobacter sp. OR-1]GAM08675.1 hypothetical protein OR1_00948 [Geobacter sp. OR-1]
MIALATLFRYRLLVPLALILGPAPYFSEPHLAEKLRMLMNGTLHRPLDIFDLCLHAAPLLLLGFKVGADIGRKILARKTPV